MEMTDELKPCPFCGGTRVEIEGKGQIWRGVKGYSAPQYFELRHFGDLPGDGFQRCHVHFRVRTEAEAIAAWNRRENVQEAARALLAEAADDLESAVLNEYPERLCSIYPSMERKKSARWICQTASETFSLRREGSGV